MLLSLASISEAADAYHIIHRFPSPAKTLTPSPFPGGMVLVSGPKVEVLHYADVTRPERWTMRTPITASAGVGSEGIFIVTEDARLSAFAPRTHRLIWQRELSNQSFVSPIVSEGVVLVKTCDAKLVALDARNGRLLWTHHSRHMPLEVQDDSRPLIVHGEAIVAYPSGRVAAYDLRQGKRLFSTALTLDDEFGDDNSPAFALLNPTIEGDRIFVGITGQKSAALEKDSGAILWQRELPVEGNLVVSSDTVWFKDKMEEVWALDSKSGETRWRHPMSQPIVALWKNMQGLWVGTRSGTLVKLADRDGEEDVGQIFGGIITAILGSRDEVVIQEKSDRIDVLQPAIHGKHWV